MTGVIKGHARSLDYSSNLLHPTTPPAMVDHRVKFHGRVHFSFHTTPTVAGGP